MIMMCIAALLGLYIPATASENGNVPPVKQEVRTVTQEEFAKLEKENAVAPSEVTPVTNENGNESANSNSAHSGYIVISGAGLLLLIILLIILL